ncbi:hypothetical protein FSP39_009899 [Pinctada imbricata]|uniref:B box-type domain-containing protein n=1 Tax=Pinctada imbricata TaxID=66713 RepID=A0AA88YND9_PINIB|nr:hypothetical protein FSP39_009899 [Pinctada imbricata]
MASSLHKFQVALRLCKDHNQKELHAYCKTCEKKICSSCIKEDHNQHDWELISDILREKKLSLPEECKEIRVKHLPGLRKEIVLFDRKIQKEDAALEHNKIALNGSRKSYIDEINKLFDDKIYECNQKHDKTTKIYKDKRDRLKKKFQYLDKMTAALDKDINTLPDHDILDMEKGMRYELKKSHSCCVSSADKYTCTTVFEPGQFDVQAVENMIGEIHSVSVEEKNDIDMYSDIITSIIPFSDTDAWIKIVRDKYAKLLNRTAEVKTMNTPCVDIIIMRSGEFVLSDENKGIILVLTKDEKIIRKIDTKPLCPYRISKTENEEILVSLRDGGDRFNLVPTSRRVVQRMTLTGKVLHTYEFREDGETRLFTLPFRAAENKNKDICVVNVLSGNSGELVVLHKDGRVKFTYNGNELESEMFLPSDVECDDKCRIILIEGYSRAIHILSSEGMYLCILCQFAQLRPCTISIQGDNLWCGFYTGRVKVFKYISN